MEYKIIVYSYEDYVELANDIEAQEYAERMAKENATFEVEKG